MTNEDRNHETVDFFKRLKDLPDHELVKLFDSIPESEPMFHEDIYRAMASGHLEPEEERK